MEYRSVEDLGLSSGGTKPNSAVGGSNGIWRWPPASTAPTSPKAITTISKISAALSVGTCTSFSTWNFIFTKTACSFSCLRGSAAG